MINMMRRIWRVTSWYVAMVMGDRAYPRYVAHVEATRPDLPVPTEREFWRMRYAEAEAKPGMRCC